MPRQGIMFTDSSTINLTPAPKEPRKREGLYYKHDAPTDLHKMQLGGGLFLQRNRQNAIYNTIKDPHWYVVQGSDTTMMPRAASLPGQ
jgi:hypothetical protein